MIAIWYNLFVPTVSILEENCCTDWYFTKNLLDFNKSLPQKLHHKMHIQRGQPKGSSRNITFPICSLFQFHSIITLFKFHVSSATFYFFHRPWLIVVKLWIKRQLNFVNHLFYHYVIWIYHRLIPLILWKIKS